MTEPVSASELRAHARQQLPEHMVPTAFMALERLPQTPNGKLDRAALPDVVITRDEDVEYVAPRAGVEESLAAIWCDTLGIEQIGAADNFFELGGHSLLAAQVRSRIHQQLGVELPLEALFEDQTLSDLARRIEDGAGADGAEAPPLRARATCRGAACLLRAGTDVASWNATTPVPPRTGSMYRFASADHSMRRCSSAPFRTRWGDTNCCAPPSGQPPPRCRR